MFLIFTLIGALGLGLGGFTGYVLGQEAGKSSFRKRLLAQASTPKELKEWLEATQSL